MQNLASKIKREGDCLYYMVLDKSVNTFREIELFNEEFIYLRDGSFWMLREDAAGSYGDVEFDRHSNTLRCPWFFDFLDAQKKIMVALFRECIIRVYDTESHHNSEMSGIINFSVDMCSLTVINNQGNIIDFFSGNTYYAHDQSEHGRILRTQFVDPRIVRIFTDKNHLIEVVILSHTAKVNKIVKRCVGVLETDKRCIVSLFLVQTHDLECACGYIVY